MNAKKNLLSIKTYAFLKAAYNEETIWYKIQQQIAEEFREHEKFRLISDLAEQSKTRSRTYRAANKVTTETRVALEKDLNKFVLQAYEHICLLGQDSKAWTTANTIIGAARKQYLQQIASIFLQQEWSVELLGFKYIARISDLFTQNSSLNEIGMETFCYKAKIESLLENKEIPDIWGKYKINWGWLTDQLYTLSKEAITDATLIPSIQTILSKLHAFYKPALDIRLGLKDK